MKKILIIANLKDNNLKKLSLYTTYASFKYSNMFVFTCLTCIILLAIRSTDDKPPDKKTEIYTYIFKTIIIYMLIHIIADKLKII